MRPSSLPLLPLALLICLASVNAFPDSDEHTHSGHAPPLLQLNETEVLQHHAPDPLSYYAHDHLADEPHYPALILFHIVGMLLAYWVLLPIVITLRIAKHPLRGLVIIAFQVLVGLSSFASSLYKKLTPDLYEGSSHGKSGFVILAITALLPVYDGWHLIKRLISAIRGSHPLTIRNVWQAFRDGSTEDIRTMHYSNLPQYVEPFQEEDHPPFEQHHTRTNSGPFCDSPRTSSFEESRRSEDTLHHNHNNPISRSGSYEFDEKQQHPQDDPTSTSNSGVMHKLFVSVERSLVITTFVQCLSGIAVYTGACRGNYLNGCLAHTIKGGIFWAYGLASFGRFLGVYAELGWAWNTPLSKGGVSFEFIESLVIFIYGITNTWMERFGAKPGSPFTTKQIQHISIAVMFWFGGLVGMAIESRRFKRWLAAGVYQATPHGKQAVEPPSYRGSFNPLPAIIIGVTGAAMSAHHQTYLFQVQIHALWGNFLVGFAILRCLTYFFLWLLPPSSNLPSRPPTEAVSSFFLTCGGLTFMFSMEQVTFAAMRHGHDDMMMFLNLAVAITLLAFCWLVLILSFKGWLMTRRRLSH